jgi:hypothetical protein
MSRPQTEISPDKQIEEIQARIQEQKARLQRMIAAGTIAQSDDDLLHEMYVTLKEMQAARRGHPA